MRNLVRTSLVVLLALVLTCISFVGLFASTIGIDLAKRQDLRLVSSETQGPREVAAAGDVNGDGHRDIVTATTLAKHNAREHSGSTWVIFGPFKKGKIDVADLGPKGFRIDGAQPNDYSGVDLAGLGDVNGDGLDDILVGAYQAHNARGDQSGVAYVVFGKQDSQPVDLLQFHLGTQGDAGFRIDGAYNQSLIGEFVDDTGDINRDGLDDMILGSPFAGSAYVVFGKKDSLPVDLLAFENETQHAQGYRINHPSPANNIEYDVDGAGDINGDHHPDVMVYVCPAHDFFGCKAPKSWVVFGKKGDGTVRVGQLGPRGFIIKRGREGTGLSVSPGKGGDLNADGKDDLIVLDKKYVNRAYVLFGKQNGQPINLNEIEPEDGYLIRGWKHNAKHPFHLDALTTTQAAGDVDHDGTPDVLIGARFAAPRGRPYAGVAFVVYGSKGHRGTITLRNLGRFGYRIDGPVKKADVGVDISGTGKLNSDRKADLLLGTSKGKVFVSWGRRIH